MRARGVEGASCRSSLSALLSRTKISGILSIPVMFAYLYHKRRSSVANHSVTRSANETIRTTYNLPIFDERVRIIAWWASSGAEGHTPVGTLSALSTNTSCTHRNLTIYRERTFTSEPMTAEGNEVIMFKCMYGGLHKNENRHLSDQAQIALFRYAGIPLRLRRR